MRRTFSKFYYGLVVDYDNQYLTFRENGDIKTVALRTGSYTHTSILFEIAARMSEVSAYDYSVTLDRATRKFTIIGTGEIELLVDIADNPNFGSSAWGLLGYTTTRAAAYEHTSDVETGIEYRPQFPLQDYIDPTMGVEARDAVVNQTAEGTETRSFGKIRRMIGEIVHANDRTDGDNNTLRIDPNGVASLTAFMEYITDKNPIEFMFDEDDSDSFYQLVIEKTAQNSKGVGFQLIPEKGLAYQYFKTGKLTFEVIE